MLDKLKRIAAAIAPTGSRVICNPAPTNTDEDFIVFVVASRMSDFTALMAREGAEVGGSMPGSEFAPASPFLSYKRGDLNFIVTHEYDFFHRFVSATTLSKRLNLLNKAHRIALFQAVLYGNY